MKYIITWALAMVLTLGMLSARKPARAEETGTPATEAAEVSAAEEEAADVQTVTCGVENGSFYIYIPVEEGDTGWRANDMSQENAAVTLHSAEIIDGVYTVRYDPVLDGTAMVSVLHFKGIACDRKESWNLTVTEGIILQPDEGETVLSPADELLDPWLVGRWPERDDHNMTLNVTKNEAGGWDVSILSRTDAGTTEFRATMYYDCDLHVCVYENGSFLNHALSGDGTEAIEVTASDITGFFRLGGPIQGIYELSWYNDRQPDLDRVFLITPPAPPADIPEPPPETAEPPAETPAPPADADPA